MPNQYFLSTFKLTDFIDIAIVAYLIYTFIKYFKNTRAFELLKGIALLLVFTQVSELLELNTINFILKNIMQVGLIALVVIFQPELRKSLTKVGTKFMMFNFDDNMEESEIEYLTNEITDACETLSTLKYGALIVLEQDVKIGDITATGTTLNSKVSSGLLVNIFVPNTPLHDGAVVIGDSKIKAAACFLPLSQNDSISKDLGTRHRAGIGVSEISDSVVIIVSEETSKISVAIDGTLTRNVSSDTLKTILTKTFSKELQRKPQKNIVRRLIKK